MHQLEHSSVESISHIEAVVTEEDIENGVIPDKRHENGGVRIQFGNSSSISQVRYSLGQFLCCRLDLACK